MSNNPQSTESSILTGENFTLSVDSSLFSAGFGIGLIIGKLLLKNSLLAFAFALGLGFAVGTTPRPFERR